MIEDYSFGRIVVDGITYTSDIIVFPGRVLSSWWRKEGHSLALEDIKVVLDRRPGVLVVGTGSEGLLQVPAEVMEEIGKRKIKLIVQKTPLAWRTYNQLVEGTIRAGAFHLTC